MDCRIKSGNDDWKALRPQYSTRVRTGHETGQMVAC